MIASGLESRTVCMSRFALEMPPSPGAHLCVLTMHIFFAYLLCADGRSISQRRVNGPVISSSRGMEWWVVFCLASLQASQNSRAPRCCSRKPLPPLVSMAEEAKWLRLFLHSARACHARCIQIVLGSTKGILQQQTAHSAPCERIQLLWNQTIIIGIQQLTCAYQAWGIACFWLMELCLFTQLGKASTWESGIPWRPCVNSCLLC